MEGEGLDKLLEKAINGESKDGPRDHTKKIKDNILDCVGNTPMIRVNNITKAEGIECELLVKAEFLNPGGSIKDRVGRRMLLDAEKEGRIKEGDHLVEPTVGSANSGVSLAMAAASKGYKMVIATPDKTTQDK